MSDVNHKTCMRCLQRHAYSGDWYGELCPDCADATDGDWICLICNARGTFEEMAGSGDMNPSCCGSPCIQSILD